MKENNIKIEDLETIKINDIEYIKKSDIEKLLKNKKGLYSEPVALVDACHIFAIGTFNLNEEYKYTRFDIKYIKKLITILNQFDRDEIVFAFKEKYPLLAGYFGIKNGKENKSKLHGVIIAPKIPPEDEE